MHRKGSGEDFKEARTVSFRIKASPVDVQRILEAAEEGDFDRIQIRGPNGAVFHVSFDEIQFVPIHPGEVVQQGWKRREQNRDILRSDDKEHGKLR
jgi:hypothetical protein